MDVFGPRLDNGSEAGLMGGCGEEDKNDACILDGMRTGK